MQFEDSKVVLFYGVLDLRKGAAGRGEKVDHAQLEIQLELAEAQLVSLHTQSSEEEDAQIDDLVAGPKEEVTERVKRFSLPDNIEERTERIIPEEVLAAPEDFREIGQPEVTEIIDLEPAKFIKIKQEFPRYVLKGDRSSASSLRRALHECSWAAWPRSGYWC
jgi:hypothetical protein